MVRGQSRRGGAVRAAAGLLLLVCASGCTQLAEDYLLDWEHGIGYISAGAVVHSRFAGDEKGIEPGTGWSITMPPLLPISGIGVCAVAAIEMEGGGDGSLTTGLAPILVAPGLVAGVSDQDRHLVSEFSIDLTFSESWHDDVDFGGRVNYESWLLGFRASGPERYTPSYSFTAGWGWHRLESDSRPDAKAEGPYLGAALQVFLCREVRVMAEMRRHFFTTDIRGDPPADGAWQAVIGAMVGWEF